MDTPQYFEHLEKEFARARDIANEARAKNFDPEPHTEIMPAKDVAARVEGIVGPKGIAEGIRKLGVERSREDIAFEIAAEILEGKYFKADKEKLIGQAVRTGVAILTEGVLVAPTEGIAKIKLRDNPDGSNYLSVYFSGPIRSAGGTVAALSVVLADFARKKMGITDFRPTETEIARYIEEINLYDVRAARLQYKPTDEEIRTIVNNCPVCIDGDPTEEFEVSVHKDVPRVETNRIRGGIALVIGEGIAQKASKVLKVTKKVGLDWGWLESLVKVAKKEGGKTEIKPNFHYLEDIVAGRPIFSYPSEKGGFRLRYGRTRMTGIAAKAIHPAAMFLLDGFPAIGTQMRIERPGKGCVVSPCDSILPPIVKLKNGSVIVVNSSEEALKIQSEVSKLLFLGDILVSYGDFYKSNHLLIPSGYCHEYWIQELARAASEKGKKAPQVSEKDLRAHDAFAIAREFGVPLHPKFTYFWHDISSEDAKALAEWLGNGKLAYDWFNLKEFKVDFSPAKEILERLCIPHTVELESGAIVFSTEDAFALLSTLGLLNNKRVVLERFNSIYSKEKEILPLLSELSEIQIRAKAPTYIGARMGRPEKAKERRMKPAPHVLFPIGQFGGKIRSLVKAYRNSKDRGGDGKGFIQEVARLQCTQCKSITLLNKCPKCGAHTLPIRACPKCGRTSDEERCPTCSDVPAYFDERPVDLASLMDSALKRCACTLPNDIKGVKGMTSEYKIPEPLEKGLLRAKHDVYVFKDGTSRFDATDMVLTHVYPREIGVTVEKLRALGYETDYLGNKLEREDQLIELRIQDVILADSGAIYLTRVANFIDDMLVSLYGLPPYYNISSREDLIGHLVITLSPHTSAGVLARIVGFTHARVGYAHPYLISARRRNCDGDEDTTMLLMDALLNFSRKFLPASRGGTMDACLVLTTAINPKEVDDEVHAMEICTSYPLQLYEAALRFASPGEVKVERVSERLGKPEQYMNLNFSHGASSINDGPIKTRYVELKTMREKIDAQFTLCEKIRAVDPRDAAERLILSHFLPDLYGNLRSFSRQQFRCVDCNAKYRRVPLRGKCVRCGGKLLLTINKGGIEKYLTISKEMVDKYSLPNYLKQRLILLEKDISSVFEDETSKQFNLADFM
ncbi:MAG: DNA polymerase II large subunit [Candidatus Micrarchaeota archaeon]